jgi:hypothetical protein
VPFVVCTGVDVKVVPLHTVFVIAVMDGTGFTVTVSVKEGPTQLPKGALGVIVYVAVCAVFVGLFKVPPIFD